MCDTVVNLERASAGFLRGCWLWPVCSQIQHRKSRAVKRRMQEWGVGACTLLRGPLRRRCTYLHVHASVCTRELYVACALPRDQSL